VQLLQERDRRAVGAEVYPRIAQVITGNISRNIYCLYISNEKESHILLKVWMSVESTLIVW